MSYLKFVSNSISKMEICEIFVIINLIYVRRRKEKEKMKKEEQEEPETVTIEATNGITK